MWTTRPTDRSRCRALVLLAVGSALGFLLGLASALRDRSGVPSNTLPDDAIALVNGNPIREDEFANAVALLAGDKREAITEVERAHVLRRLIEEELLVQQGIARGLVASDRAVRQAITTAMLDAIIAESASEQPTDDALRAFSAQHRSLFQDSTEGRAAEDAEAVFKDWREQIETLYLQYKRDDALREYLGWLRSEAKIVVAPEPGR